MKIYVSSTFEDLKEYRDAVYSQLRRLQFNVVAMEDYVANEQRPLTKCIEDVADADVYLGIFAWRYGYVPSEDNPESKSITELEYRAAAKHSKDCLIFLLDDDASWQPSLLDSHTGEGNRGKKIEQLREELRTRHGVSFFSTPDQLASAVSAAVQNLHLRTLVEIQTPSEDRHDSGLAIREPDSNISEGTNESVGHSYTYKWFIAALEVAESVGLITGQDGRGIGSGFLVLGSSLHERFGSSLYLLTPSHIITPEKIQGSFGLPFNKAQLRLAIPEKDPTTIEFTDIAWFSPLDELDVSVVQLKDQPSGVKGLSLARGLPLLPRDDTAETDSEYERVILSPSPTVIVVGHPAAGNLKFSIADRLIDHNNVALQYMAMTEPGSGGSAVLNENLKVVGMHRLKGNIPRLNGVGQTYASEAVSLLAVQQALRQEFG